MDTIIQLACVAVTLYLIGSHAFAHQDTHHQLENIQTMLQSSPDNASLHFRLAELQAFHQEYDLAYASFDKALELDPAMVKVYLAKSEYLLIQGKAKEALAEINKFAQHNPMSDQTYRFRAQAYAALNEYDRAISEYRKFCGVVLRPSAEIYLEMANLRLQQGHEAQAIAELNSGMNRLGPLVVLREKIIEILIAAKSYDSAIRQLNVLLSTSTRKEILLFRIGEVMRKAGRQSEAVIHYRKAVRHVEELSKKYRSSRRIQKLERDLTERLKFAVAQ